MTEAVRYEARDQIGVITFAAVLAISSLTYRLIETPSRRALLRWRGRRQVPAGDALASAP